MRIYLSKNKPVFAFHKNGRWDFVGEEIQTRAKDLLKTPPTDPTKEYFLCLFIQDRLNHQPLFFLSKKDSFFSDEKQQ